jgi:HTH-type transcriptional regulator / antitoxin HigA
MTVIAEKYFIKGFEAPSRITSDEQNEHYIEILHTLVRRGHLSAAKKNYAALLTLLIESYEDEHYPVRAGSPIEVLQTLMEANDLRQKDLAPLFGSESMVSMVLSGARELSKHHIEKLSKRFHVSPELFFD